MTSPANEAVVIELGRLVDALFRTVSFEGVVGAAAYRSGGLAPK